MKYLQHPVDADGWTGWIYPNMDGYRMGCCDCGLVHDMQFKSTDAGAVALKARRNERATAAKRRHKAAS